MPARRRGGKGTPTGVTQQQMGTPVSKQNQDPEYVSLAAKLKQREQLGGMLPIITVTVNNFTT